MAISESKPSLEIIPRIASFRHRGQSSEIIHHLSLGSHYGLSEDYRYPNTRRVDGQLLDQRERAILSKLARGSAQQQMMTRNPLYHNEVDVRLPDARNRDFYAHHKGVSCLVLSF